MRRIVQRHAVATSGASAPTRQSTRLDYEPVVSTISGYVPAHTPYLIEAKGIAEAFGKPTKWFVRDRVRKDLYVRGFPAPVIRGRWLRTAVFEWLETQGRLNKSTWHNGGSAKPQP